MEGLSLLVWLIVAVITAFIAARKNRSFIGWLIIGLILPIVGFILILVLPEGQLVKEETEKAVKEEPEKVVKAEPETAS